MAGTLTLVDSAPSPNTITLSPLAGVQPDRNVSTGNIIKEGITGALYVYKRWQKIKHYLEFNNVSKADADVVNGWCRLGTSLTYTPDTDNSGVTYQVKIINDGSAFDWMPNTIADTKFQGSLLLREI